MTRLFLILALLCSLSSQAAQVALTPPANVGGSFGSYVTKSGAAFSGAAFQSGFTTQVAGRAVTVPATWRLASNAGQFAATAVRGSPALAVGSVALWLSLEGLRYVNGQYVKEQVISTGYPWRWGWGTNQSGYDFPSKEAAIQGYRAFNPWEQACWETGPGTFACRGGDGAVRYNGTYGQASACPVNTTWNGGQCVGTAIPATQADWDALGARPLTDAAATQLSTEGVPLPLQNPEVSPIPQDIPLSDPHVRPDGKTVKDLARVTPNPSRPDTATVEIIEQQVDPVTGQPINDPVTGQPVSPEAKEDQDPCDLHPDRVGCLDKGQTDEQELDEHQLGDVISPVSVGGGGSCPPDRNMTYLGKPITFSFQPICQGATLLNPVVLAIAWLLAGYILIGAIREG